MGILESSRQAQCSQYVLLFSCGAFRTAENKGAVCWRPSREGIMKKKKSKGLLQIHLDVLHGIFLKRSPRVSNLFTAHFASCFRQQKSRNPPERLICEAEKSPFETQLQPMLRHGFTESL